MLSTKRHWQNDRMGSPVMLCCCPHLEFAIGFPIKIYSFTLIPKLRFLCLIDSTGGLSCVQHIPNNISNTISNSISKILSKSICLDIIGNESKNTSDTMSNNISKSISKSTFKNISNIIFNHISFLTFIARSFPAFNNF